MTTVTLNGTEFNTNGNLPAIGEQAPDFKLVDKDLNDKTLADFAGKKKVISIVPSLDTGVCATSTKVFNEKVAGKNNVVMLIVSADLPFAQSRFCDAEKLGNVSALSMMRSRNFAKDYGMLINDGPLAGVCGRAVVVLDENNNVIHSQLVKEITQEPDYEAAMAAIA